jgi:hypothetical protein
MPAALHSKKFIAFLIAVAVLAMKNFLGIDEATATKIAGIIGAYLLGQGFSDGMTGGLTSSLPGTPQWTPGAGSPNA